MKLPLAFQSAVTGYTAWLRAMGYSSSVVYHQPRLIAAFLGFITHNGVAQLEELSPKHTLDYYEHLKQRSHRRKHKSLSNNYIGRQLSTLRNFAGYYQKTHGVTLPISLSHIDHEASEVTVLTQGEISRLYQSCAGDYLGIRDAAMLGIYYGCGLRRSEGRELRLKDLDFKAYQLFVREGKGYKSRHVPFNERVKADLEAYLQYSRPFLHPKSDHVLISKRGNSCSGSQLLSRIKQLAAKASITKAVGLHTLRHSIATHLLAANMPLHHIQQFLGHSSLASTQIYTHVQP